MCREHNRRTVGGDLDDVVGGVGMGLGEVSDDDFVDALLVWHGFVWSGYSVRQAQGRLCPLASIFNGFVGTLWLSSISRGGWARR